MSMKPDIITPGNITPSAAQRRISSNVINFTDDSFIKKILSKKILKTTATLSLTIALLNILLQWMHLLEIGQEFSIISKCLINVWYMLVLALIRITLQMTDVHATHIATALGLYVAVIMMLIFVSQPIAAAGINSEVCPFFAFHSTANILRFAPAGGPGSIRHSTVVRKGHVKNGVTQSFWYSTLNLPIIPLFWLSLGWLSISIERLLYQHTKNSVAEDIPPGYLRSRLVSSDISSYLTPRGPKSLGDNLLHGSSSTFTSPIRAMIPQQVVTDTAILGRVEHDTNIIKNDMQRNLEVMSALIPHIKSHQHTTANNIRNSEPNTADSLKTLMDNLSFTSTQFQPMQQTVEQDASKMFSSGSIFGAHDKIASNPIAPSSSRGILFDPCNLTEQVADALAYYSDSKEVELIVHTPVGSAAEWYLTHYDLDPIRSILIKILGEALLKAKRESQISLNLKTEIPKGLHSNTRNSPWSYTMTCVWQIVYRGDQIEPLKVEFCTRVSNFLQETHATHGHTSDNNICIEELRIDMDAVPLDNIINPIATADTFLSPLEKRDLYSFSKKLVGIKFLLLTTSTSQFVTNLSEYIACWGGKIIGATASNWRTLVAMINELDAKVDDILSTVMFIADDLAVLDTVIKSRLDKKRQGCPIVYFAGLSNAKRVDDYEQTIIKEYGIGLQSVNILCKPAGPRKILQILRMVLFQPPVTNSSPSGALHSKLVQDQGRPPLSPLDVSAKRLARASRSPSIPGKSPLVPVKSVSVSRPSPLAPVRELSRDRQILSKAESELSSRASRKDSQAGNSNPSTRDVVIDVASPGDVTRHLMPVEGGVAWRNMPIKVMIVEDNFVNLGVLSTFLRNRGLWNVTAKNGKDAIELWKSRKIHLILMDIKMPVMNGIEAAQEIRRIEQERRDKHDDDSLGETVILALTAYNSPEDRDRALIAGCNDWLVKPVNMVGLETKISEWGSMASLVETGKPRSGSEHSEGSDTDVWLSQEE